MILDNVTWCSVYFAIGLYTPLVQNFIYYKNYIKLISRFKLLLYHSLFTRYNIIISKYIY
jgi:hypothetical protein